MHVLLQDDKLARHVSIETDDLLDETVGPHDSIGAIGDDG